jgi:hypothetical protein
MKKYCLGVWCALPDTPDKERPTAAARGAAGRVGFGSDTFRGLAVVCLAWILLFSARLHGDPPRDRITVQLRDGSSLTGLIIMENDDSFLVKTPYGEFLVRKDQIREKTIERVSRPSAARAFRWEAAAAFRFSPVISAHELDAGIGAVLRFGIFWPDWGFSLAASFDRFSSGFDAASRLDCRDLALEGVYRIGLSPQFAVFFRMDVGLASVRAVEPAVLVDQAAWRGLVALSTGPQVALGALRIAFGFGCRFIFEPGEAFITLPLEISLGASF